MSFLGDLMSNSIRGMTDPFGATQAERHDLGMGSSSPPSQEASQLYAQLTQQQWSNYTSTFVPIENQLIKYATDTTQPDQAMQQASSDVNSAYGAQAGATARELSGLGINLDPAQQEASARSLALSKSIADVQGQNTARDLTIERQQGILGNPMPGINATTMPVGV